ncbi:MAG: amidohydrolase family protein [Lentisphaerae bacterium]|nr:amidohydrolase family protein [Lentisphaerota bacterium]
MTIIDCFCGIGPWCSRPALLPYKPKDILRLMDAYGISKALVHSNQPLGGMAWPVEANRQVAKEAAKNPRFMPAFYLARHPYRGAPTIDDTVRAMRKADARAAWLWLREGQLFRSLQSWLVGDWLAVCSERQIPVLMHIESLHINDVHGVCKDFPNLRLILTGVGYGSDPVLYPLLRKFPNLHVCLGHVYIPAGNPALFLRHFPAERLVFGSGLPFNTPGGLIAHVMYADISDADKEKILGGNIQRLLAEARL